MCRESSPTKCTGFERWRIILSSNSTKNHVRHIRTICPLFDPHTGFARPTWSSVSVIAQTATMADALSTAFSLLSAESIRRIASRLDGAEVYVSGRVDGIRAL
ncbi:MAG: FAD:protein FMN transferase [Methylocystis sp.]|uniref:FAD:protein FMN transferase n=1 Tax=Methylocystis sp. TaxID=1911079 RepID=UPI003DA57F8B